MVFDSFNLGTQIESNNSINYTSYLDQVNCNLYIIQSSNINIYNITGCNLTNKDSNIYISCNINLYNDIEHFYIDTDNYLNIYSVDLSCNFTINKLNLENSAYSINNTDSCNFISGYYYNDNKYLITESGKDVYRISSDNTSISHHILLANNAVIKNRNNNVVSILIENILYVIIADFNIIIKCDIKDGSNKTKFIIENYGDTIHKFSKAIYSRLKQKIYLIPYNLKYLCSIDTVATANIQKGEILTFRNKQYLVNTNIKEIFSTAIENQGYIYMIPKTLNLIFIYSLYTDSLHNIIDISAFNTIFLENNKFVNAHLYEDKNHKNLFMISNNSENIGVIDYDVMDGAILENDFSFDIITKNIFNSDYQIEDGFIELGSKIQYSSSYKNGFVSFKLKSVDPKTAYIFEFRLKTNIYMDIKNKLVAFYKFDGNTDDSENDYHLTNSVQYIGTELDSYLDLTGSGEILKLSANTAKFENNFTNEIGIGFKSSNLGEDGTIFKYKSIECSYTDKTNLKIIFKNIESNIQSNGFDHIFLNADQNSLDIYLNGSIKCNISSSENTTNNDLAIGSYDGYLNNLFIFKEKLTGNEISALNTDQKFHSEIFRDRYDNSTSTFTDDNRKPIFNFYKPVNEKKYQEINIDDLLTNNKIQNISVNNIYSIENDTVYFIPYNYDYLLALDVKENVIRLINIKRSEHTNHRNLISNYIDDVSKGKFKASIIVGNNLYIAPYIELYEEDILTNSAIILIYNFVDDNEDNFVNIKTVDISQILNKNAANTQFKELFSTILFYNKSTKDYLFFINENTFPSVVYNITDDEAKKVSKDDDYRYIDGYINDNDMYLLDYYGSNIYVYDIVINRTTISLTSNNHIDLNKEGENVNYDTPLFSKMLAHNDVFYFIPYNTNYIAIYSNTSVSNEYLSDYTSNQELYKGGTIMELNNNAYLIMVPYYADKLYMYNITQNNLTYIDDVIFKTNRFTGCTVDLKGNLYMNTVYGDVLYYSLSIAKFYKQPRLPVLIKNKQEISFKDLYEKFHTDYIYPNYNYNNKQIKLSDYYNNGGAEYYTVSAINDNKFIFEEDDINPAKNVYENISYDDFVAKQTEECNMLELSKFKTAVSQRYEYYDYYNENVLYTITSIAIDSSNKYVHYIKEHNDGNVQLYLQATNRDDSDIEFGNIERKNPDVLEEYTIDISQYSIKAYVGTNTERFSSYTIIIIDLKEGVNFDNTILLDSSNFIENTISDTEPNQTMTSVLGIEMNISGEVKKGIKITLDDFNGNYLSSLNSITIKINDNGIIKYYEDTLIELINPKTLPTANIDINIKEAIGKKKLYCKTTDNYLFNITQNSNRKISKLTIEITEPATIDLDDFIDLIYLREIVIISFNNRNDITIINGDNLKQDIIIIIYENFDNLIELVYLFNSSLEPDSTTEYLLIHNNGDPTYDTKNGEYPYIRLNGENQYLTLSTIDFDIKSFGLGFYLSNVSDDNYLLRFDEDFYIKVDANSLDIQINTETLCNINSSFSPNTWHSIFFNYNDVNMYDIYIDDAIQPTKIPYDPFIDKELIIGKYTESNVADYYKITGLSSSHSTDDNSYKHYTIKGSKSVEIDNNIYIFGGYIDRNYPHDDIYLNYLYEFNTTTCNLDKIELQSIDDNNSNIPPGRSVHSMVAIGSNIYIFGGYNGTTTYLGDLYKIDTTSSNSTKIELQPIDSDNSNIPSERKDHTMVAIENNIYIFGGYTYDDGGRDDFYKIETNDTNVYNSTKITLIPNNGYESNIPTIRTRHSMVAIGNNIYIFGGYNGYNYDSPSADYNNDLYKIEINDTTTFNSTKITLNGIGSDIPDKRANHYMVIVDNYIYILLGYNRYYDDRFTRSNFTYFKDLYKIDTYGNSKKIPLSYFNNYLNFSDYSKYFNITAINNDIYVFYLNLGATIGEYIESTTVYFEMLQPRTLLKITPTNREHYFDGNIAELRINNVITSDSEIIDNYSNLDYYYNQSL